jgi:hypothetical protein
MVNWILPTRGVQAILSITVLGLMAYGKSSRPQKQKSLSVHRLTLPRSLNVVVDPLAPILSLGSKLPHLHALVDRPLSRRPHCHTPQIQPPPLLQRRAHRAPGPRGIDHDVLVRGLHCARRVSE